MSKATRRRKFTPEYKQEVVQLVLQGRSVLAVCRDLGLVPSAVSSWVRQAKIDGGKGKAGELASDEKAELARLRRENRELRMEREILKNRGLLREGVDVRFTFVDAEKASFPVTKLCKALDVSTSGYYAWRDREEPKRVREDRRLTVLIRAFFEESRRSYGSPRIHEDLVTAAEHVGRNRVIRLMQSERLVARVRRRYRCTTMSEHDQPIAPNILRGEFDSASPNQRWVSDTTELLVDGGRLFLAAVVDLFSRFVVGWAVSTINDRHLTIRALEMAIHRRCPEAGLVLHSDQGSTYASDDYRRLLDRHGITCSMSRRGNCYDNAVMESWFSTFKAELGERFVTPAHAKQATLDYVEVFYNRRRRHSSLGYLSPAQFEQRHYEPERARAA